MPKENKQKPRGLGLDGVDIMAVIGLVSVTYGCVLIDKALAFIVFGGLLLAAALTSTIRRSS